MKMIIMQGCSGSGKSTLAKHLAGNDGQIFSTDDYFIKDGNYQFNPLFLGRAHNWNKKRAREACALAVPLIIIDNTNTKAWEAKPYVEMALEFGYEVSFVRPQTAWADDPEECSKKNTHGVPLAAIKRMLNRMEDLTVQRCLSAKVPD